MEKDGAFDRDRVLVYARKYFRKNGAVMEKEEFEHLFPEGNSFRLINRSKSIIKELRIRYISANERSK